MNKQARMMSKKSLSKPSKELKRWMKSQAKMSALPKKSSEQELEEWNNRTWELKLTDMNLSSALVALALRPWAWKSVRLERVVSKTETMSWKCTTDSSLKALLPGSWTSPSGWTLGMEERRGSVRRVVLSRSKSLRNNCRLLQEVWDKTWKEYNIGDKK